MHEADPYVGLSSESGNRSDAAIEADNSPTRKRASIVAPLNPDRIFCGSVQYNLV